MIDLIILTLLVLLAIYAHKKHGCKLIPETTFKRGYNE